jgi:hypothetical protein
MLQPNQPIDCNERRMLALKNSGCMPTEEAIDDEKWYPAQKGVDRGKMQKVVVIRRRNQLHRGIYVLPKGQISDEKPEGGQNQNRGRVPADEAKHLSHLRAQRTPEIHHSLHKEKTFKPETARGTAVKTGATSNGATRAWLALMQLLLHSFFDLY